MESWLDVRPLRIPRPKLLSSGMESRDSRSLVTSDITKDDPLTPKSESIRQKINKNNEKWPVHVKTFKVWYDYLPKVLMYVCVCVFRLLSLPRWFLSPETRCKHLRQKFVCLFVCCAWKTHRFGLQMRGSVRFILTPSKGCQVVLIYKISAAAALRLRFEKWLLLNTNVRNVCACFSCVVLLMTSLLSCWNSTQISVMDDSHSSIASFISSSLFTGQQNVIFINIHIFLVLLFQKNNTTFNMTDVLRHLETLANLFLMYISNSIAAATVESFNRTKKYSVVQRQVHNITWN